MLRRASQASSAVSHASLLGLCVSPTLLSGSSTESTGHRILVTTQRCTFFTPGTPGKGLLRDLTTPSEPPQAFSPLEKFRFPSPPSASDARPFGSLNRDNQLRRYVNVNTANVRSSAPGSNSMTQSSISRDSAAASDGVSASAGSSLPPPAAQMDLSKLVRRHANNSASSATDAVAFTSRREAAASTAAAGASSSVSSAGVGSGAASASLLPPATSTHATVARAQAAIAAAHRRIEAAQQHRKEGNESTRAATANVRSSTAAAATAAAAPRARRDHKGDPHASARQHSQLYEEHCTIGWSPEEFYHVVADVEHYTDFLPWCAGSEVHTTRRVRVPRGRRQLAGNLPPTGSSTPSTAPEGARTPLSAADTVAAAEAELVDAIEMTATLTIGFSFLKEQYTSRVTLYPGTKIVAALHDAENDEGTDVAAASHAERQHLHDNSAHRDSFVVSLFKKAASTAGAAKRSILKHLLCEWEFCPVPGKPNTVEVIFSVSFEFKNPLHSRMIMSNVVTLMTRSFERRCESLYGPPSASKESLPLFH
ncbi:hypothetical protein ABB37_06722 [Leptomonas pyrrhocoris]|uniref:Coenzyme Q-binding protein COQ10 START domain-containing protein n=1 Tax=Leptomonas pyrrhocoris TaxID=157538 RepID=A0A0N0VEC2_LEPPY|nr:hypothetical protein ABB37_06722 [Leptomonas pyrrhocoris]KPA77952.1 hypothetical protein ABB37_06722 [Leptomonas pyrrhocoris]|eukprot:XP_015656391.1 hypothetical protein ABB37_06722 [Leptomonas pyrrhocoris]